MPATQAFVLMNLDLVAVPLYAGAAGMVTIYCGAQRARKLLSSSADDAASAASALNSLAPTPQTRAARTQPGAPA